MILFWDTPWKYFHCFFARDSSYYVYFGPIEMGTIIVFRQTFSRRHLIVTYEEISSLLKTHRHFVIHKQQFETAVQTQMQPCYL